MNTAPAGGAETIAGCVGALIVLTAMSFHFVTSLACATAGTPRATAAANTANHPFLIPSTLQSLQS
jgi:hypothetical protein